MIQESGKRRDDRGDRREEKDKMRKEKTDNINERGKRRHNSTGSKRDYR
jgi:hypothetical protein